MLIEILLVQWKRRIDVRDNSGQDQTNTFYTTILQWVAIDGYVRP